MNERIEYRWNELGRDIVFAFVYVRGTRGCPFHFGSPEFSIEVEVPDFFVSSMTVTQQLWNHVMGEESNPSLHRGNSYPLENDSWDFVTSEGGLLDRLNHSDVRAAIQQSLPHSGLFRLPTETEWEYAARGGPRWSDAFRFSGSNDIDAVAWYDRRHGDHTQPVGIKQANQLGIYDMSGNVWEWCQDAYTEHVKEIPTDGSAHVHSADGRILRGGCFHNWAVHCTVSKRYEIGKQFHDGCIGVRLVFSVHE